MATGDTFVVTGVVAQVLENGLLVAPRIVLAASFTVDVANLFNSACVALRQYASL
jgi:hypothetical protein